jgi:hypothetical protein
MLIIGFVVGGPCRVPCPHIGAFPGAVLC